MEERAGGADGGVGLAPSDAVTPAAVDLDAVTPAPDAEEDAE
jgi:hypothetical protein